MFLVIDVFKIHGYTAEWICMFENRTCIFNFVASVYRLKYSPPRQQIYHHILS